MSSQFPEQSGFANPGKFRRKSVSLSQENLVRAEPFSADSKLPLVIQPAVEGLSLKKWIGSNRELVRGYLHTFGGILFRGFAVEDASEFETIVQGASGNALNYMERSSPRSQVQGNIYTSTEHPANQSIFLHNEQSYNLVWPLRISFFCEIAAEQGGETSIADCRRVLQRIDPAIRQQFVEKSYIYVRNFGTLFGLSWQEAFQTTERSEVEKYCRENAIEFEWKDSNGLRTRQVRPVMAKHPYTGEMLWFNHLTFFHVSTLVPFVRDTLLKELAEEDLPNNTYYGDGSRIEESILEALREAYTQETILFPWQKGDVLMLDNMLVAHGRTPFIGPRKVLVAMAEPSNGEKH